MSVDQEIILFEDPDVRKLLPLAATRPVYDLRCGALTLGEKITRHFPGWPVSYQCRDYVQRVLAEEEPPRQMRGPGADRFLFVNGRLLLDEGFAGVLRRAVGEVVFRREGEIAAAWVGHSRYSEMGDLFAVPLGDEAFQALPREEVDARFIRYPWDLVAANGAEITADLERRGDLGQRRAEVSPAAHIERREAVHLGRAWVDAGAVLDARSGPIWVADGARISSHATIEGPAAIGEGTVVRAGAYLSGGVTLGPMCRVGGEVAATIIQGFSNKQHGGYLGSSYLGAWVNLGAGTETSDLKNNYAPVRVMVGGKLVNTGEIHVGLFMGDHSKSAIGSLFSTGTVVGVSCNYFASGLSPRYLPSFTWCGPAGTREYELERALLTVRQVMERRNQGTSVAYEAMLRTFFDLTAEERQEIR